MITNDVGLLNRGSLDSLFLGASGGTVVGIYCGCPVAGCLAGVSLGYCLSAYSSRSSGNDGDSGRRPGNISAMPPSSQFMVRTGGHHSLDSAGEPLSDRHIERVAHDSDSEELTDSGQCARSRPYIRRSRGPLQGTHLSEFTPTDSGQCARSRPYIRRGRGPLQRTHLSEFTLTDSGQCARSRPYIRRGRCPL